MPISELQILGWQKRKYIYPFPLQLNPSLLLFGGVEETPEERRDY